MIVTKMYIWAWLFAVGLAGILFFTGNFENLMPTIFGFVFATLAFIGMVAVLPWWVDKQFTWKY